MSRLLLDLSVTAAAYRIGAASSTSIHAIDTRHKSERTIAATGRIPEGTLKIVRPVLQAGFHPGCRAPFNTAEARTQLPAHKFSYIAPYTEPTIAGAFARE